MPKKAMKALSSPVQRSFFLRGVCGKFTLDSKPLRSFPQETNLRLF